MDKLHSKFIHLRNQPVEQLAAWRDSLIKREQKRGRKTRRRELIGRIEAAIAAQSLKSEKSVAVCTPTTSAAEVEFITKAAKEGWNVTNRGWPDFLMWRGDEIVCVEVKCFKDDLSEHQKLVNALLAKAGIKCYKWRPDSGFTRLP